MKISEIRYYLNEKPKKELIDLILKLYRSNAFNQELLRTEINPENEDVIKEKYKKNIKAEFFPEKGDPKLRYSVLRKAINDFKKISKKPENIADLMLCYIENGVDFTNEYGDIDEVFYIRIENLFSDALKYIFDNRLEKTFDARCFKIKINSDNIGWGFSDSMEDLYYAYYDVSDDWYEK